MNEEERKVIAFLLGIVFKLSIERGSSITENETQQLSNLMDEYGTDELDEREFRY